MVKQNSQFTSHSHHSSLFGILSATFGDLQSKATEIGVLTERTQDIVGTVHEKPTKIAIAGFGDMELGIVLTGLVQLGDQAKTRTDFTAFPETKIQWHRPNPEIEFLQEQWLSNLNVEITVEMKKWEYVYNWLYEGNLRYMGVAGDIDPDIESAVRIFLPEWQDDRFEKLMEEARGSITQRDRIRLYQRANKLLVEEAIIMPTTYSRLHMLIKPWLKVPTGENNSWYLKDFIIEPH
jgi:ABC-type transport system substrate-binding protein